MFQSNTQFCMGGCGKLKDTDHLFMHCDFFGKIWVFVSHWLGIITVNLVCVSDHLLQFEWLGGFSKNIRSGIHLILLSTVWVICKERNSRIFST